MKVLLFFCILYSFLLTVYCDHQQWEEKRYRQVNENYNRRPEMEDYNRRPEMEDYNRRQEFEDNQNRQKVEEDMRRQEWEEKRLRKEWEEYKGQMGHRLGQHIFDPNCDTAEFKFECFKKNFGEIEEHNRLYELGYYSYKKGLNHYAHYNYEDFKKKYLMRNITLDHKPEKYQTRMTSIKNNYKQLVMHLEKENGSVRMLNNRGRFSITRRSQIISKNVDWTKSGCIDDVADQGACGSCYAFSAVTVIESALCIERKFGLIPLSKQQIVDCTFTDTKDSFGKTYDNAGCDGGNMGTVFDYLKFNGNIPEKEYPYDDYDASVSADTGYAGECMFKKSLATNYVDSYTTVSGAKNMKAALKKGLLSTYMYISDNLYMYESGIITDDKLCRNIGNEVNHGVVIVGHGSEKGVNYWIVRNTWGSSWGERGYFRIIMGKNLCNIEWQSLYVNLL